MRQVLITGGAGFLGSHLCDRYHRDGWSVVCVDNLSSGDLRKVQHLDGAPRFRFVKHDIRDPLHEQADLVLNFACIASPLRYQHDPIGTMLTNVLGTANLLSLSLRCGATFLQSSTSEVYGQPLVHPQPETYNGNVSTQGPRACYDEGKRAAEALCADFARVHHLDVRIVRIFNTYGPRMASNDGRVVSNFIAQALAGDDITIYGTGHQTRSLCYIDDLIEGIVALAASEVTGPVNLGGDVEISILELANLIVAQTRSSSRLVFEDLPQDDPLMRCPDLTRARDELGWTAAVSLEHGIGRTANALNGGSDGIGQ